MESFAYFYKLKLFRYSDLISKGSVFEINPERMNDAIDDEIFNEADGGSDDEIDAPDDVHVDEKISPWMQTFKELKKQMVQIPNENIYKKVTVDGKGEVMGSNMYRIQWIYNMFFEGEKLAFDSTYLGGKQSQTVTCEDILPGLWLAAMSMTKGEKAEFIIHHSLMWGKYGCPPRIKPKADVLAVIELINFVDIGRDGEAEQINASDRRKFHVLKTKIIEKQKRAIDNFNNRRFAYAKMVNQEVIRELELCQVADDAEQAEQRELLVQLYTHLSDCYLELEDWKKACSMVNELRRLTNVKQNVKILVNEAVALSNIADGLERSIELLRHAQRIEPNNGKVNQTLACVVAANDKYKAERKAMWQRAFQTKKAVEEQEAANENECKSKLAEILKMMCASVNIKSVPLIGHTKSELDTIRRLLVGNLKYEFKVRKGKDGNDCYAVEKLR